MKNKNYNNKTKQAFINYLKEHPEERFWQAIRNFSGYDFIYRSNTLIDHPDLQDTFFIEADKEL